MRHVSVSNSVTTTDGTDSWSPVDKSSHDLGAAREHGIIDAITDAGVHVLADAAYQGSRPARSVRLLATC